VVGRGHHGACHRHHDLAGTPAHPAGMPVSVPLRADPVALGIAAGGLLLLTGLTLAVQDALARRLGTGPALRVGE